MSRLYIVPTPVGNLEDITLRALRVLKEVDFILAEDTRTSSVLLKHFEISKPMFAYHKFNEHKSLEKIIQRLKNGENAALISDAGTPSISDPGFLIVRACITEDIQIDCLPGATALIPALVNSGLPSDTFVFEGFLPIKKGRQTKIREIVEEKRTIIFYESPYRIIKTLTQIREISGEDRRVSISREISKQFEETVRGSLSEVIHYFEQKGTKGEFVIVLSGKENKKGVDSANPLESII